MNKQPMMKCGHAANAYNLDTGEPSCVICQGDPGADQIEENPPDLTNRKARCDYYGKKTGSIGKCSPVMGAFGHPELSAKPNTICRAEISSDTSLPFFKHKPNEEFDMFYCGCHGWD